MSVKPIQFKGDFINGEFTVPTNEDGKWINDSPADFNDHVMEVKYKNNQVDQACAAAKQAYKTWSKLSVENRIEALNRWKEQYSKHQEELALVISRETGKPLWETRTEAKAMVDKFTITFDHSLKLVKTVDVENALPGVNGHIYFRSRGVMAVIGPFNFPGHLPNGHIVPALVTGNTIVFKPSELTPATAQFMADMCEKAQLPKGVFNVVYGTGETGRRLVGHKEVDGILFTGSYETGLKIKQETMEHYWKILALEMGGKNATVIWDDADFEKCVYESVIGSFLSAGQRCSCTSRIILHESMADKFIQKFYESAKKIKIGHWSGDNFMGPLINRKSVETYLRFQEIAQREGAEKIMRGKVLELEHKGNYVTPSIYKVKAFSPDSVYQKSEIFGPNVAIYTTKDFDEAMAINNSTGFGLVMSLFTKQEKLFEIARAEAKVGQLNWNRTTNGASSRLPFGGLGKSGNDRPSAHFAVNYCTVPMSSLIDTTGFDKTKVMTGLDWND